MSDTQPLDLYRRMLLIRLVEEEIAIRYGKPGEPQEMRCPVHLSIGQEAVAVGVCATLEPRDLVFSTHRNHAHYLAKGGDLEAMLAEIYGKATGCLGGRGGSMHLMDRSVGMFVSVPIVASSIPLAVGAALSFSLDKSPAIGVAFLGDASLEEGVWHESANFASLRRLPVLFVCENNLYSVYTPLSRRQVNGDLPRLAKAHDMPVFAAEGSDADAVYAASREAVEAIRGGAGPAFLSFDTYRYREHCGPNYDDHLGYRPEEEVVFWQAKDPVSLYRERLIAGGALTEAADGAIHAEIRTTIDAAFEAARDAELPVPDSASRHVYA